MSKPRNNYKYVDITEWRPKTSVEPELISTFENWLKEAEGKAQIALDLADTRLKEYIEQGFDPHQYADDKEEKYRTEVLQSPEGAPLNHYFYLIWQRDWHQGRLESLQSGLKPSIYSKSLMKEYLDAHYDLVEQHLRALYGLPLQQ